MKKITYALAVLLAILLGSPAFADYVIKLKNGRTVETEKYWEDRDQIKFNWEDGIASVPKKNVVSIEWVKMGLDVPSVQFASNFWSCGVASIYYQESVRLPRSLQIASIAKEANLVKVPILSYPLYCPLNVQVLIKYAEVGYIAVK